VVQVVTGAVCHLDAHLVGHALEDLDLAGVTRLWIENVGNLVCPAAFACGETRRAVLVSTAEGDDKPEKYPAMIASADLLVITKIDLLPHVDFDPARCEAAARAVRPDLPVIRLSARTGEGMESGWVGRREGLAMCLAVPGRVRVVEESDGLLLATVDFGGVRKRVCLETLPEAKPGDWILVHAGFGLQILDEAGPRRRPGRAADPEGAAVRFVDEYRERRRCAAPPRGDRWRDAPGR
jgi:hydrogenase assembly chaperone HypC/HupF